MDSLIHNRLNFDGFVKSPSVRLRRVALHLRRCGVPYKYASLLSPARSGIARLVRPRRRAFYFAIPIFTFYEIINFVFMESGILFEYTHIPFLFPLFFPQLLSFPDLAT